MLTLQTQDVNPMLSYGWSSIEDGGPILNQHCVSVCVFVGAPYSPPPPPPPSRLQ